MSRGRLEPPNLDDRTWKDIVDQAKALIPNYAPEWTDHNPSDLGITLIELFAWLVEGMIYRLNRVPEKNFIEFLNLLGLTRDPATPASTWLTYTLAPGQLPTVLPKGHQAATPQTDNDEALVFETDADVRLLPINLTTNLMIYKALFLKYANITAQTVAPPLSGRDINLFPGQSITLSLGFDAPTLEPILLHYQFSHPAQKNDLQLTWLYSQGALPPASWPVIPGVVDNTEAWQKDGYVSITVPAAWSAQNPKDWPVMPDTQAGKVDQPLFWIGIRISNLLATNLSVGLAHILFNSVQATNALSITTPEFLGTSNGEPFQTFELQHQPLYKDALHPDPYGHIRLQVREPLAGGSFGPWTDWTKVEDLPAGVGTVYRLNPVTGTVQLGNFLNAGATPQGHGSIPPRGSQLQAVSYRYVAGDAKGNVAPDTIKVIRTPLPGVIAVTNPGAASGGSDEESVADAKRRGPEVLRNRYRSVTMEDYEYLAQEATTDVNKVRCLPPRLFTNYDTLPVGVSVGDPWTYGGLNRDVGNVNVIIIPDAPLSDGFPTPSQDLLREVADYLATRRTVTAILHVTYPRYLPIRVHLTYRVWRQAVDSGLVPDPAVNNQVRDELTAKINDFLHPTRGGADQKGWQMGEDMIISSLFEYIKPEADIGFISDLKIEAMTPLYTPVDRPFVTGVPGVWVQVADYEIICRHTSHAITVTKI